MKGLLIIWPFGTECRIRTPRIFHGIWGPYSDVLLNGEGIRSVPYAHDLSVDPITFDSWNDDPGHMGNQNNQIHNGGTIWASFLYDMTWELIFLSMVEFEMRMPCKLLLTRMYINQ